MFTLTRSEIVLLRTSLIVEVGLEAWVLEVSPRRRVPSYLIGFLAYI